MGVKSHSNTRVNTHTTVAWVFIFNTGANVGVNLLENSDGKLTCTHMYVGVQKIHVGGASDFRDKLHPHLRG